MTIIEFDPHKLGRKKLAQAIADHLGVDVTYAGTPTLPTRSARPPSTGTGSCTCQTILTLTPLQRLRGVRASRRQTRAMWG